MRGFNKNIAQDALIADIANMAETATYTTAANISELNIEGCDYVDILMKVTGEAAANGVLTFSWLLYNVSGTAPTVSSFTSTITMTSNTITKKNSQFLVAGYRFLKLLSIVNGDAAKDATAVNAYVSNCA